MAWYPKILLAKQIQDDLSLDTVNGCVIGLKRVGCTYVQSAIQSELCRYSSIRVQLISW